MKEKEIMSAYLMNAKIIWYQINERLKTITHRFSPGPAFCSSSRDSRGQKAATQAHTPEADKDIDGRDTPAEGYI